MHITQTSNTTRPRRRRPIVWAFAATIASISVAGSAVSAHTDPPPCTVCAYAHHPAAADLGGIMPINFVPSAQAQSVLRSELTVGTDCSIYEVPV